ncbi:Uncharacterized protein Adt_08603 [Abeliophyllum distichum]|uniref:Uncharacterized protein n=1 Tax=Abeliophyllum distichum TaxID=126358 RepID=A0ABD1UET7_9LAMI
MEKSQPVQLLEESWFFGNFLERKTRMLRSYSDPCTSSNYRQEIMVGKSLDETYESIKNLSECEKLKPLSLIKKPSMASEEQTHEAKGSEFANRQGLGRAPSLPTSLEFMEGFQDEESDFCMGKLIRQASLIHSDMLLPPRHSSSKAVAQSCSMPRNRRGRKKPALGNLNMEALEEMRKQYLVSKIKTKKILTDFEFEEVQGFKDLGFNFDVVKDLDPSVVSILPGLKEKKGVIESEEEEENMKPYLSEAWMAQSPSASSSKRSTEDIKKQIKFWARAVASNVR